VLAQSTTNVTRNTAEPLEPQGSGGFSFGTDHTHFLLTRLAQKMDVLPLARMIGHTDLRQLMVYYNQTATELAKLL